MLTNSDGLPVMDSRGRAISLPRTYIASNLSMTEDGQICYPVKMELIDESRTPSPTCEVVGLGSPFAVVVTERRFWYRSDLNCATQSRGTGEVQYFHRHRDGEHDRDPETV